MKEKLKNNVKEKKGITLIALVVTIVVLLILAAVSISMLGGENGIITQAQNAKEETRGGEVEEERNLWMSEITMSKTTGETVQSIEEKLEELKNKGLLSEEEVNTILADEENSIQIGSKNISFKVEEKIEIVEPENIDDWEWIVEDDGTITITGYKGNDTTVIIPNHINGIPVKSLVAGYRGHGPDGAASIWDTNICKYYNNSDEFNMSYKCYQYTIKEVIISKGIEKIEKKVFTNSMVLERIEIPSTIKAIGDNAFISCGSLTEITIPSNVTTIGNYAFSSCTSLTEITIPSNVTTMGNYAFSSCTSLTKITIPSSIQTVGSRIFDDIETITVDVPFREGEKPSGWADDWNETSSGTVNVNYQK